MKHCWITLHSPGENCVLKIGNHRSVKVLFFKKKSHLASKISTICKSLLTCLEAKSTQRCRTSPPSAKTCSTESASFRVREGSEFCLKIFSSGPTLQSIARWAWHLELNLALEICGSVQFPFASNIKDRVRRRIIGFHLFPSPFCSILVDF